MSENRHAILGIHHEGDAHAHPHRGPILKRARLVGAVSLAVLLLGGAATVALRVVHADALARSNAELNRQYVSTTSVKPAKGGQPLSLPGTLQGMIESPIYARASGYVLRWNKDIGSRVSKGEVLAEIDTPEVDQQLSQAIAARQQAASSLELAKSSAERWEALRKKDAVTQQELNERSSAYAQAQANLAAAEANVRRLQQTEGFKRVTAPFSGVITARNVEVGDLINGGNGGASSALFRLAQVDTLRVYVFVPQAYAQRIKAGDKVTITQAELPGKEFEGTVARTAGAIDAATRTLQIEVNLPNKDNALLAGAYVQVQLPVSGSSGAMLAPTNVLLFRPEGPRVAVVGGDGRVKLQPVTLGHDLGNNIELLSGVSPTDKLVVNPPDSLADGDAVQVRQPTAKAEK
ncbi:efflux RND transporter periplasmic adaptor subunit [Duganella callida]|uniref:Efflux RND transporter periplasmic adaptor subunit n=1 Tax=Duganella callida TaxID=2561932 RepID=A0A4Y9RZW8_9BURK|nr:efflux RND transporter periplasmic adaptor subunit [Duganella callida]TFW14777.1 efflux RND transporter periplasmic adaptor subunit [Duganella callida]